MFSLNKRLSVPCCKLKIMSEQQINPLLTTVAVFSQNKFLEMGYEAKLHPDGYVYFAKSGSTSEHVSELEALQVEQNSEEVVEQKPVLNHEEFVPVSETETCAHPFASGEMEEHLVLDDGMEMKFFAQWELQLKHVGYAKCANTKCNFISLSVDKMVQHYTSCDGVSKNSQRNAI